VVLENDQSKIDSESIALSIIFYFYILHVSYTDSEICTDHLAVMD
jgi:hypothetical protein